jgi:transcriptional regulator with XRE-family HTH domain
MWVQTQMEPLGTRAPPAAIGAYLLMARLAANLTQEDWAHVLGHTRVTIWRWEHGVSGPSPTDLALVRELLKRPVLRRRIYLDEKLDLLLQFGELVEPIESSLTTYQQWRKFMRELGLVGTTQKPAVA